MNVPVEEPPGTITEIGTIALELFEERATDKPLQEAVTFSETVPVEAAPPTSEFGETDMLWIGQEIIDQIIPDPSPPEPSPLGPP